MSHQSKGWEINSGSWEGYDAMRLKEFRTRTINEFVGQYKIPCELTFKLSHSRISLQVSLNMSLTISGFDIHL